MQNPLLIRRVEAAFSLRGKAICYWKSRFFSSTSTTTTTTNAAAPLQQQQQQPSIELFKYAICPFCNQVKAILDFIKVEYSTVEVNPLTKAEISWSSDYRKVPIVTLKEHNEEDKKQTLKGSDEIVSALLEHPFTVHRWPTLADSWPGAVKNNTIEATLSLHEFASSPSALQWTRFAKDELASLLYPNLCPTLGDSYRAFGYVDQVPTFGTWQKFAIKSVGSLAMYMAASRVKRKRNISDAQEALFQALMTLEDDGLAKGTKDFVSGQHFPNMGDVTLFGTLRALEGLSVHDRVLQHGNGSLHEWYRRVEKFV